MSAVSAAPVSAVPVALVAPVPVVPAEWAAGSAAAEGLAAEVRLAAAKVTSPDWLTVKSRPAIDSVPTLATWELNATRKSTTPLPSPLEGDVTVIHAALLRAVQGHP